MLQSIRKARFVSGILFVVLPFLIVSCKTETTVTSAEETIYLADYESPKDKWGYIDTTGALVIRAQFDEVGPFSEGLAAVNVEGKWGYIDREGKWAIPPQFRSAWAFHEQLARVKPFDKPEHFITPAGKEISSPEWAAADDFSEGLARIAVGNSFGYINAAGKILLPAIYTRGWNFHHGVAVIAYEEKFGLINSQGEQVIEPFYDHINYRQDEKLLICAMPDYSIVINTQGEEILKLENTSIMDSDGQLISIRKNGQMFLFDLRDKKVLPGPGWLNVIYLGENRWAGRTETGYVLLDADGNKLSIKSYLQINKYNNGLAATFNGLSWIYLDVSGNETMPDVFELAWDFKNGFARAAYPQGIAFLNRRQQLAFYPPSGTMDMRDFSEGFAPVQISN